jgi:hypothetical protein
MEPPDLKTPIRPFTSSAHREPVCDQCAVRRYKEEHPLTWNMARGPTWRDLVRIDCL